MMARRSEEGSFHELALLLFTGIRLCYSGIRWPKEGREVRKKGF